MTSALQGDSGTGKADKGTDKLREWDSDMGEWGGEGFRKSENFADVMNRSPLSFQLVSDDDVVSQEVFHMALEGH